MDNARKHWEMKKIQGGQDIQTALNKDKFQVLNASKNHIITIYMSNLILVFYMNFKKSAFE